MEHIVSPWFIYLVTRLDVIGILLAVGFLATLCSAFVVFMKCDIENIDWRPWDIPKFKGAVIALGIIALLVLFIPNKNTAITMYVASKVTTDVVKESVDNGKDAVKFVLDENL